MSSPSPRRALRIALAALAAMVLLVAAGCIAPTLPVPPPSQPDVSAPDGDGIVTVTGAKLTVSPYAEVTVWNQTYSESPECRADRYCNPGVVRIANSDGSFAVRLKGKTKDLLYVWQTTGGQQSAATEVYVR